MLAGKLAYSCHTYFEGAYHEPTETTANEPTATSQDLFTCSKMEHQNSIPKTCLFNLFQAYVPFLFFSKNIRKPDVLFFVSREKEH